MTKITVAIPTFNRADLIHETIRSVLSQGFADYELLVVDDGSADNTFDVVHSIAPEARYIWQENQGIANAKNRCVREATGTYLTILDSDDILTTDSLRVRQEVLDLHPKVGFVYGASWSIDSTGHRIGLSRPPFVEGPYVRSGREELQDLLVSNHVVACTVMARRRAFEDVGLFDPDFKIYEDWDMWIRIAKSWSVAYVDNPVAGYRDHAGNVGSVFRDAPFEDVQQYREMCLRKFLSDPVVSRIVRLPHRQKILARHHYVLACRAHALGRLALTRTHALKSLSHCWVNPVSAAARASCSLLLATLRPRMAGSEET